jgi:acyl carrier protein
MDDTTQTTKDKILETITGILKKQKRFKDFEITGKTHLDRDLKMSAVEIAKFARGMEVSFGVQITSNTMVFLRDMESLVFYIDTQIFKKITQV